MCNIQFSNILINILISNSNIWPKAYIYTYKLTLNKSYKSIKFCFTFSDIFLSLIPTKHLCILTLTPFRHLICTNFLQLCRNRGVSSLGAYAPDESNQGGIYPHPQFSMPLIKKSYGGIGDRRQN